MRAVSPFKIDQLDLLQYLHSWALVRFDSTRIELSHRDELAITLVLGQAGVVRDYELVLLEKKTDDTTRHLTSFLFERLKGHVKNLEGVPAKVSFFLRFILNKCGYVSQMYTDLFSLWSICCYY